MTTKLKFKRKTRSTKNQIAQIYLIEAIGMFRYKMGWAFSAVERCEKLKRAQPPVNYRIIEVFDCYNAEGIETALHKKYAAYKVELEHSEEWFELPSHALQEVRQVYKNYQKQWRDNGEVQPESSKSGMEVVGILFEKIARLGKGTVVEKIVVGLDKKVFSSKKITIWSITNLIFEVLGGTAKELIKGFFRMLIGKKSRSKPRRRGFSTGLYYHKNQQSAFNRIGAAAIALCVAGVIMAMML